MLKGFKTTLLSTALFSSIAIASNSSPDRVQIDGKTYECDNSCSVTMGPPTTVSDCCGGLVGEVKRQITIGNE